MRLSDWLQRVEEVVEDATALEDIRKKARGDGDLTADDLDQLDYRIDTYITDLGNFALDASA